MSDQHNNRLSNPLLTGCLLFFLVMVVFLLLSSMPVHGQSKTPGTGYVAPPNALCHHCDTSSENLKTRCGGSTTRINVSVPWDGTNSDFGYVLRYLEGRTTCAASWICGVGGENEGLRAREILKERCLAGEIGDRNRFDCEPTRVEVHDYGCQLPDLGRVINTGAGSLRLCEGRSGKGTRSDPFIVDDPGVSVVPRSLPCWTGTGRVGRFFVLGGVVDSAPVGPVEPTPVDPIDFRPIDPKPIDHQLICLVLRIDPTTQAATVEQCK